MALFVKAAAFVAVLLAAPAVPQTLPPSTPRPIQHSGILRDKDSFREVIPPQRYQGDTGAVVIFANAASIAAMCGATNLIACAGKKDGTPIIAVPNPCLFANSDLYAAILCHEMGHVNGWPAAHGD
jgi:hypothetical protein